MLIVIMLIVISLNVIMLNVVEPKKYLLGFYPIFWANFLCFFQDSYAQSNKTSLKYSLHKALKNISLHCLSFLTRIVAYKNCT